MTERACTAARAWLSAFRDGEALADAVHSAHLASCRSCGQWERGLDAVGRASRLGLAESSPAWLTAPVLAAWDRRGPTRSSGGRQRRVAAGILLLAGLSAVVLAIGGFATSGGYLDAAGRHLGWELFAFEAALGSAFILSAIRPERWGPGLLPISLTVAVLGLFPVAAGAAPADPMLEASHLSVLFGVVGLFLQQDRAKRAASRAA